MLLFGQFINYTLKQVFRNVKREATYRFVHTSITTLFYVISSGGFFSNTESGNDIKERGSRTDLAPLSFWRGVGGEAFMPCVGPRQCY